MLTADDYEDFLIELSRCQRAALDQLHRVDMTKTYAIYMRPRGTDLARRHRDFEPVGSAKEARIIRHRLGIDALIHVGETHPDPLPLGERLWQEPGGPVD